ncbi:hypothetical protein HX109_01135 [Galbibacter sp. BG1]|uniref:hypothetical protein n=1 Tax=Galbibacter sp. BG1 TaxID=1170699 RepID=UPI0015BA6C6D|nr:hypothetical protein [Galbibacter sp. BG1]QLE00234.1 hypothetical protein HX109_01135 [Galbibacter sp. BG1]
MIRLIYYFILFLFSFIESEETTEKWSYSNLYSLAGHRANSTFFLDAHEELPAFQF